MERCNCLCPTNGKSAAPSKPSYRHLSKEKGNRIAELRPRDWKARDSGRAGTCAVDGEPGPKTRRWFASNEDESYLPYRPAQAFAPEKDRLPSKERPIPHFRLEPGINNPLCAL